MQGPAGHCAQSLSRSRCVWRNVHRQHHGDRNRGWAVATTELWPLVHELMAFYDFQSVPSGGIRPLKDLLDHNISYLHHIYIIYSDRPLDCRCPIQALHRQHHLKSWELTTSLDQISGMNGLGLWWAVYGGSRRAECQRVAKCVKAVTVCN